WPVVFITTDLINEYFGQPGVRRLTFLAVGMISYAFLVLLFEIQVPAWESSPVPHDTFARVFGQSMWIIVGSLMAFLIAQLLDVVIFQAFKRRTGHRMLWLRATGSTVFSQLVDTFIVLFVGFRLPSILKVPGYELTWEKFVQVAVGNYSYKLVIAILITPIIYIVHGLIDRFLERTGRASTEPDTVR
ncbi:MAG: queuosine precursor transporter, partial [Planctomycetota bacterium]